MPYSSESCKSACASLSLTFSPCELQVACLRHFFKLVFGLGSRHAHVTFALIVVLPPSLQGHSLRPPKLFDPFLSFL